MYNVNLSHPDFTAHGKRYRIICTEKRNGRFVHTVKNLETKQVAEVSDESLSKWGVEQ